MALLTSEIEFLESGLLNLGGALQESPVSGTINTLFDRVSGSEVVVGTIEYRCIYVRNSNLLLTLFNAAVWVSTVPVASGVSVKIGIGGSNAAEPAIADEADPPVDVVFYPADTVEAALALGDLTPGDYVAIWIERTVAPGSTSISVDGLTLTVLGDAEVDGGGGMG